MPQYVAPVRDASSTGLSATRLRRLVAAFRRIPRYQVAADAAGISAATLVAWRRRGQQDLDALDEQALDAVLALRDPHTAPAGRPVSWREMEAQVGVPVSRFAQLVLELAEAESETACELFGLVMEAARGRYDVVEQADGSVTQKVIQLPQRTASAWVLERVFGFTKPAGTGPAEAEVDALTALRRGTAPLPKTLVFVSRKGSPWLRGNALRRIWWPLLDRAGIPHCGFHAARRGHISELLANGAPLKAVSARVGHADSGLTVNVYQQVRSDADRQLADLTGRLLAGQSA